MTTIKTKVLNRNVLKYILIVLMTIDHLAWAFIETASIPGQIIHFFGRIVGPTMVLLLVEGFQYTKNRSLYALRLFLFGMLSWPVYNFMMHREWFTFGIGTMGMIFTLYLILLGLWLEDLKLPVILSNIAWILLYISSLLGDWPVFSLMWGRSAYKNKDNPLRKWIWFYIIACIRIFFVYISVNNKTEIICQTGVFLVPIIWECCYNHQRGKNNQVNKWFFYIYYPVHLAIICILIMLLNK